MSLVANITRTYGPLPYTAYLLDGSNIGTFKGVAEARVAVEQRVGRGLLVLVPDNTREDLVESFRVETPF